MTQPKNYKTIIEGYVGGGSFSIYGSLKGCTHRNILPTQTCWCMTPSSSYKNYDEDTKDWPKEGKCFPLQLCSSCNINKTC